MLDQKTDSCAEYRGNRRNQEGTMEENKREFSLKGMNAVIVAVIAAAAAIICVTIMTNGFVKSSGGCRLIIIYHNQPKKKINLFIT